MGRSSITPPLRLVFFMWLVYSIQVYMFIDLGFFGILPRSLKGLLGVFTAPMIHGSLTHLISNTFPLIFLGSTLYIFYDRIASTVFVQAYFLTNTLVWIFGRPFYHIGASGLVYALATFLIFFGIFRRNVRSIIISLIILLVYGGLIYGIFPYDNRISWESHLFGAMTGLGIAYGMSRISSVSSR